MANIKWSGIEQIKYNLTANWYCSAYYGNDIDVDAVGPYNRTTNPLGHGGPTRPYATLDKVIQVATKNQVVVFDSGHYKSLLNELDDLKIIGDGNVQFFNLWGEFYLHNATFISGSIKALASIDCKFLSTTFTYLSGEKRSLFVNCNLNTLWLAHGQQYNNTYINCTGTLKGNVGYTGIFYNNLLINCTLEANSLETLPVTRMLDYSIFINSTLGGKDIATFKSEGNFFIKSYDENDVFAHTPATVSDIQSILTNYISPVYIDTFQELIVHLKPSAHDILKYGGLNGSYIGAAPVMHWFDSVTLWDTHRDAANTTNLGKDPVSGAIRITEAAESGTFRSQRISLPKGIIADPAIFAANLVYNIEGSVKQGVSNQRIDTTPDLQPDNTANQRVVYDFKLATAPNTVDALSPFKNFELDREATVDSQGRSHLDDNFDSATETKQTIQDFMIEFTLRKVVIA